MKQYTLFDDTKETKCCFTGYRPLKFPFPLIKSNPQFADFENSLIDAIFNLPDEENCFTFISGMAIGFDIIAAETVLLLRDAYKKAEIRLVCALPFSAQADTYSEEWRIRYYNILDKCDEKIILSDNYSPNCYQKRNRFMIDNSDFVITWFDGRSGGTMNTLKYANSKGRGIINLYDGATEYILK